MTKTTVVRFRRYLRAYQFEAQRAPVEITRRGRRELILMSADHYDWLIAAAQRTHRTATAAPVVIEAVTRSEMEPQYANLDKLLK